MMVQQFMEPIERTGSLKRLLYSFVLVILIFSVFWFVADAMVTNGLFASGGFQALFFQFILPFLMVAGTLYLIWKADIIG